VRKNTSWVRILLSAALLGVVIYFVQRQQPMAPTKRAMKPLPAGAYEDSATRFAWVPRYPDANVDNIRTQRTSDKTVYAYQFEFQSDFQPILTYYENQLRGAGFKVERKGSGEVGVGLHAEDANQRRIVDVLASKLKGISEIDVTAAERDSN
jgi:hypothetical protein